MVYSSTKIDASKTNQREVLVKRKQTEGDPQCLSGLTLETLVRSLNATRKKSTP